MELCNALTAELRRQSATLRLYAVQHDDRVPVREVFAEPAAIAEFALGGATLRVTTTCSATAGGGTQMELVFSVVSGIVAEASLGVCVDFDAWSREDWVFLPACVYAGNRFRPKQPEDFRNPAPDPENWVTSTSSPGLNSGEGSSRIQVLAGDCATPCVGVQSPASRRGLLLLTDQGTGFGDTGLHVEENDARTKARVLIKSPGAREGGKYNWKGALPDRGATLKAGDTLALRVIIHAFAATSPEDLYAVFVRARKETGPRRDRHDLPFETAFKLIEDKHNIQNWVEKHGYWSVGMREVPSQDWQTGWVGGPNTMWPLLLRGNALSASRALRVWDFIAEHAATPSGFVKGTFGNGAWNEGGPGCYLRYAADTLYFLMKTLLHLRAGAPHTGAKDGWLRLARGLCDGLVRCWKNDGHIPHYVDAATGATIVGGSCAGALAPAGLTLAARYFDEPGYRAVAEAAARRYRDHFLAKGITNGGPGDIFQNIDSESSAALLESFAVLMEESDGDAEWTQAASRAAAYFATWVTSYDFCFPPQSTFAALDMLTTGTVWANVQNKHAAPGICTLSGASLLKLWRATGDDTWIDLLRDIARCLPQYVSRADRPICDIRRGKRWKVMPPGWVNERVNMSDWEVRGEPREEIGVGEIFGGSCWSEPAVMNTIAEVPGICLNVDTLELRVIDHLVVQLQRVTGSEITLRVTNTTPFPAESVLLAETTGERRSRWLGVNPLSGLPKINVPPLTTANFIVARGTPVRMPPE